MLVQNYDNVLGDSYHNIIVFTNLRLHTHASLVDLPKNLMFL